MVDDVFERSEIIDVVVSNAGYGLFGAAEELSDAEVEHIIATKFGIEGFCESVAQEVAPFNIGITLIEPGGARTEFRYGSAKVATLMPEYEGNPAHNFLNMLNPANGLAPGDPIRMAARIIESVETEPAPMRMMLGSQALAATIARLKERVADYETQTELAASTDFPAGE